MPAARGTPDPLHPYVPDLLLDWANSTPSQRHRQVDGTLAFVDISGFTRLTERLAKQGRVGAEELSDALNAVFGELVTVAAGLGGDLVKWGGDAVLMLFHGPDHARRGVRAALDMRATLRTAGRLETSVGKVTLRMSVGVHSDLFDFFLVGDPALHRELLISGPAASECARLEGVATAGQVVVSTATAALLAPRDTRPLEEAGAHLARDARPGAGWPVAPDPVPAQRSGAGDLELYLPVEIRRRLLEGSILPEHRPITVAFVQFSGTDQLVGSDGAGAVTALDDMVRNVAGAADEFGVTFFESDINADGGKIMLTAGAPRALEHPEERMLRAARRIMDRAGTLPLRIGINRGHIFSGDFGPAFRRTFSVKGDAINLAARVMGKARPGQVLATTAVLDRCPVPADVEALEPFLVKGKRYPVHAAAVRRLREDVSAPPADRGPLVGRETEAALLEAALDRLRARQGGLVEVLGEPGIGKSRLLDEVRTRASGLVAVTVECNEYASNTPYAACRSLLRQVLGIGDGNDPEPVARRLEDRIAADRPDLLPWLPLLGIPLDLRLPDTQATRDLDDEFRQERLESVTVEFLGAVLPTPTLLILDDTQVMDAASVRVFHRLSAQLQAAPWLLLVGRRDFPSGFMAPDVAGSQRVRLRPLDEEAAVRLVQEVTTGRPLPPDAVRTLAEQCGGNPMFLQSLVAAAGRSGSIAQLPDSVEGVIGMLLDRLDVTDRLVVRRAAVLGRVVDRSLLDNLLADTEVALDPERLGRLTDFLEGGDSGELRFRHGLLREVAYQRLPYRQRTSLHASVGAALEASGNATDNVELLSLHFFHAARFEKAWAYSRAAGDRAWSRYANREAVDFYERAAECAHRRDSGVPSHELAVVMESLAEALTRMGLLEEAAAAYQRALRAATDPIERGRIVSRQARIDQRLRHFRPSIARLARGLAALRELDEPASRSVRSVLQVNYGICRMAQGHADDALAWARRGVDEAHASGDAEAVALAHATMHGILVTVGRQDDAAHGELALEAYRELDDPTGQAHCLNNIALEAFEQYRWTDAAAGYEEAQLIFHRTGDVANEANAMFNRAELLVRQGHHPDALLENALRLAQAVADDELEALVLREMARSAGRSGRLEDAHRLATAARQRFSALGETGELAGCQLVVAEAHVCTGDNAGALTVAGTAVANRGLECTRRRIRGFALLGLARQREAEVELRRGLEAAEALADRYERGLTLWGLGLALSDKEAPAVRRRALADLRPLGVRVLPVPELEGVAHHGELRGVAGTNDLVV